MSVVGGVRGPARMELLRNHRLDVFTRVFGEYCDGKVGVDDVRVRALKMKLLKRKRSRRMPHYLKGDGDA